MSAEKSRTRQEHLERAGSELMRVKLSGDLLERIEDIAHEMDVSPEEVVRLAVQRVVGGMAPDLEAELKLYISATGIGGRGRSSALGLVERKYRQGPAGTSEIIL